MCFYLDTSGQRGIVIASVASSLFTLMILAAAALTLLLALRRRKKRGSVVIAGPDGGSGDGSNNQVAGIPVSDNPAYIDSRTNTLVYDYVRST